MSLSLCLVTSNLTKTDRRAIFEDHKLNTITYIHRNDLRRLNILAN